VNALHWLGGPPPVSWSGKASYTWPDSPLLPFFALRALLRELENGTADLLILGQGAPEGAVCLLLGSPAAVGRWNLPPAARIEPLAVSAESPLEFIAAARAQAELHLPEGGGLSAAALSGLPAEGLTGLNLLVGDRELALAGRLVRELAAARQNFGLLAGWGSSGGLAMLVERL
jgi:hypothetical protein